MTEKNGVAIGIDFGTSYCRVAYEGTVIEDELNRREFPSVVSFTEVGQSIGSNAVDDLEENPGNTIFGVKKLIGRTKIPDEEEFCSKVLHVKTEKDVLQFQVKNRGKQLSISPEEVTSIIIRQLKEIAEKAVKKKIAGVAISVPRIFDEKQKNAIVDAMAIAKVSFLGMINEGAAVALAFSKKETSLQEICVVSIGAGYSEVLIAQTECGKVTKILSSKASSQAGDFLTESLVSRFEQGFRSEEADYPKHDDSFGRLRVTCEGVKHTLSLKSRTNKQSSCRVRIPDLYKGKDLIATITSSDFEEKNKSFFSDLSYNIQKALDDANISANEIEKVILVGGVVCMPRVLEEIRKIFDKKQVSQQLNKTEAVAEGVSHFASWILNKKNEGQADEVLLPAGEYQSECVGRLSGEIIGNMIKHAKQRRKEERKLKKIIEKLNDMESGVREKLRGFRNESLQNLLKEILKIRDGWTSLRFEEAEKAIGELERKFQMQCCQDEGRKHHETLHSLWIGLKDGNMLNVAKRNTELPWRISKTLTTTKANQTRAAIAIYKGDKDRMEDNVLIGNFELSGILPAAVGVPKIDICCAIDKHNVVTVSASDRVTKYKMENTLLRDEGKLSDEERGVLKRYDDEESQKIDRVSIKITKFQELVEKTMKHSEGKNENSIKRHLIWIKKFQEGKRTFTSEDEETIDATEREFRRTYHSNQVITASSENCTSLPLGIETMDGIMSVVVERGTEIPCCISKTYTTVEDDQTKIVISVFEGNRAKARKNRHRGDLELTGISAAEDGDPKIDVCFKVDRETVTVFVSSNVSHGGEKCFKLSEETERRRLIFEEGKYEEEDASWLERAVALNELKSLIYVIRRSIKYATVKDMLDSSTQKNIEKTCHKMLADTKKIRLQEVAVTEIKQMKSDLEFYWHPISSDLYKASRSQTCF